MTNLHKTTVHTLSELDDYTKALVPILKPGTICLFYAEMGVGKTTFVRSFMSHLGVIDISSPTYTLVNNYNSTPPVYHIDLYRLESEQAVDALDLDYYFSQSQYLFFVEWAEKLTAINFPYVSIAITKDGSRRIIDVTLC